MKISELIKNVSNIVVAREIIDHGTIRCIHSDDAVRSIESVEGSDVETGTIGDDDLAAELAELGEDGDRIADLDLSDIVKLHDAYRGEDVVDYLNPDKEDELINLDALIDAARELV